MIEVGFWLFQSVIKQMKQSNLYIQFIQANFISDLSESLS